MPEGAYNRAFQPVARPGNAIEFAPLNGTDQFQVAAVAPLNEITLDADLTIADGTYEKIELTELEVPQDHLAQYRLPRLPEELPDDVEIEIDHDGKQQPLYETKNVRGSLTNETGVVYGNDPASGDQVSEAYRTEATELFVHESDEPNFTFYNRSGAQQTVNLTFEGFMYRLASAPADVRNPVVVPVESIQ